MSGNTVWCAIKHTSKKQGYDAGLLRILSVVHAYIAESVCVVKSQL